MPTSLGKVKPFILVSKTAELYAASGYPVGGTNPPVSNTVSAPLPPGGLSPGPLPGTNCIDLITLRDYYKIPYPPTTPLSSPPVIGIVSFGGGIYGQPVSSGKYSGFWRCTDISGANGAPIQILVVPINGAINAPNADDGGATLENTVDVATVNAFYGMINQGRDAPVYTPPVIILYIAPSDDISEMYNSFYTALNNPVICNGRSYLPSVLCCSWGAPEVAWTQKVPFPTDEETLDTDPNPAGIAVMNEINDLLADATKRGINICVASGDIPLPTGDNSLEPPTIMFPASSPYVTSVGGSSVFFPNGSVRNYTNPAEFAWTRSDGGVSNAFPIPDYQADQPGTAFISAKAFLASSENTTDLLKTALGEANISNNDAGVTDNISLVAATKKLLLEKAQAAFDAASDALDAANNASAGDAASLQAQLTYNSANTALVAAKASNDAAQASLAAAQDAVVKAAELEVLLDEAGNAYNVALLNDTDLNDTARDAALLVANEAVAQAASSVFAPTLVSSLSPQAEALLKEAVAASADLYIPYDSFPVGPPLPAVVALYTGASSSYPALANLTDMDNELSSLSDDIVMSGTSSVWYTCKAAQEAAMPASTDYLSKVIAYAAESARIVTTLDTNVSTVLAAQVAWNNASVTVQSKQTTLDSVLNKREPSSTVKEISDARDALSAANQALTDASVVLADAEYAALKKANDNATATANLDTATRVAGYTNYFTGNPSGLLAVQNDASGSKYKASLAQLDMGNYVVASLNDLAASSLKMVTEMSQRYTDWVAAGDASNNNADDVKKAAVTASEKAIASAQRTVDTMNALSVAYNNAMINGAISSGWPTTGVQADGQSLIATAKTAAEAVLSSMYSALLTDTSAYDYPGSSTINAAVTAITNAKAKVLEAVTANSPNAAKVASLQTDTVAAKLAALTAEGSVLYLTSVGRYEAEKTAIVSAADAIYDEFTMFNILVNKAKRLTDLAIKSANLANYRVGASLPQVVKNKTFSDAQNAAYAAIHASQAVNDSIVAFSLITPSLVDSAIRSKEAINYAATTSNIATAANSPPPVTPQFVENVQGLVLKAKSAALAVCESQPTNEDYTAILTNWNTAVLKGAAALDALDETADGQTLANILTEFSDAIKAAANYGNYYTSVNIADSSALTLAATAAYDYTGTYFTSALNGAALTYLMNAASDKISLAVTASEVANASETNPLRANATALWHSSASKIGAIVGLGQFSSDARKLPYDLMNTVSLAYQQTTSRDITGVVSGTLSAAGVLTVTRVGNVDVDSNGNYTGEGSVPLDASGSLVSTIAGTLAPGSTISWTVGQTTYTRTVTSQLTNTAGSTKGGMGTYQLTVGGGEAVAASREFRVTIADVTAAENQSTPTSQNAYRTAVDAYNAMRLAYDSYNKNFIELIMASSATAANAKVTANTAMKLALASAARTQAAAMMSAKQTSAMATGSQSYQADAAVVAADAAYAAADNVNMYRCVPDVAMHANADDLPVIYRLNGGNVYVGGTSIAAAMFAGFLGVTQSHSQINYFMNPVLYNNFSYPSPMFYDISGTDELLNSSLVTYTSVVENALTDNNLHGSYNTYVGLGSIRGDALASFLEAPNLVQKMLSAAYPLPVIYNEFYDNASQPINTLIVRPGTTADVYVYVYKSNAYNTNVEWSCSSPYNATVTQTLETIQVVKDANGNVVDDVIAYRARVTGVVPIDALSTPPVITVSSTDGSNVFTTVNVNVLSSVQVVGVSISALNEMKNPANTILYLGNTLQLIATVTPVAATNKAVYWWSSNTSIVNVDTNGLLTPLSPGQVTIRVTTVNNNISASISVYVPTPMTGISVSPAMVTLNPNLLVYPLKNTQLLKALVTPNNVDYKNVKWTINSWVPLKLPAGTTDSNGASREYNNGLSTDPSEVSVVSIEPTAIKRDSNGNILDNTQEIVKGLTNGRAIIRVSTDGVAGTVYGTYSADVIVNVVTPITNLTLEQTNMVIALNPSVKAANGPLGVYADQAALINPLLSTFKAVNPVVNVQYSPFDPNKTVPAINAIVPDRNLAQSYDVTATLFPAYPSNMNLIWTSSNPKVAIVSNNTPPVLNVNVGDPNNGLFQITEQITPLSNGSTVITATTADGNKVASVNVTVTTPVTSIVLSPMPVTLNPGKQYALQATVLPTTATITDLVWSSTNTAVATVDQYGVVTAVSTGSCGISVTTADGDYTAMATINVVTPLVGVSLVLNTPTPIHIGDMVQILVVMTPTTASDQAFTWSVTNGVNGNIFTNGPAQNGNIVYLDAAQAGSSVFTVTTHDGNKQASISLTVAPY